MLLLPMKTLLFAVINIAVIKASVKTYHTSQPFTLTAECNDAKNVRKPFIIDHGCWCQGYSDAEKSKLGKPVTELDHLCQKYHRCLHCVTNDDICNGEDTASYDADAPVRNDCTQVVCSTANKCQQQVCECTAALSTGIEALPDTLYNDQDYQSYQTCDRSVSRPPTGFNACPSFGPQVPAGCSELTGGLLTDEFNNGLTETEFNDLMQTLPIPFYVRRLRQNSYGGYASHQDTIYKRLTPVPTGYNMFTLFRNHWRDAGNAHHVDFDIFDNMANAIADVSRWNFCNFNEWNMGYPKECGPSVHTPWQFISSNKKYGWPTHVGSDWAFYLAEC